MKPMNTKQIAEEAAERIETDVSDVIIDKPLLIAIIQAAIEKWDESRRIQLSDYANEILRLQKELSRATHASEDLGDDQESGLPCECHGRISPHHGRTPAGQRAKRHQ